MLYRNVIGFLSAILLLISMVSSSASTITEIQSSANVEVADRFSGIAKTPESDEHAKRNLLSFPAARCVSFSSILKSQQQYYGTTCSGAVNYPFFLPANTTLESLEAIARGMLSNSKLSALPHTCLESLTKLVCSSVYLKCQPNIDLSNKATYNFNIYSGVAPSPIPIPFQRPCRSVCSLASSTCYGVLGLLGVNLDCTSAATTDYTFGAVPGLPQVPRYDQTNNTMYCNPMNSTFQIAPGAEPYIGKQCKGIADASGSIFILPAQQVNSALSPIQGPYVVQSLIEHGITEAFSELPLWLSPECRFALKKFFCRSAFPKATSITFQQAFLNANIPAAALSQLPSLGINPAILAVSVYLPSFPAQAICQDYQRTCSAFIAAAGLPSLVPNCSQTATLGSSTVKLYPDSTQTIMTLTVPIPGVGSFPVAFTSAPDNEAAASKVGDYSTVCPQGFVVPDDPSDIRVQWIPGSGCAVACRNPLNTDEEYTIMDRVMFYLQLAGIGLTAIVFFVYVSEKQRRESHQMVLVFAFFACALSISMTLVHVNPTIKTCANNAAGIDASDGPSGCVITAYINMYCLHATCAAWMLYSADRFLKIVMGVSDTKELNNFNIMVVVFYPLIVTIGVGLTGLAGYDNGAKLCLLTQKKANDIRLIGLMIIPIIFLVVLSVCLKISTIFTVAFTKHRRDISSKSMKRITSQRSSAQGALIAAGSETNIGDESKAGDAPVPTSFLGGFSKSFRRPTMAEALYEINDVEFEHSAWELNSAILFNLVFTCLWAISCFYNLYAFNLFNRIRNSFTDWATCAFSNFDGNDNDWHRICGDHPAYRPPFGLQVTNYFFLAGQGTLFGVITLANPSLWYDVYQQVAGLKEVDDKVDGDVEIANVDTVEPNSKF